MLPIKSDYFRLHVIVLLLGLTAILGKLISVPTIAVVFYRTLLATIFFACLFYQKKEARIEKKDIFKLLSIGFILGLHWLCFFGSARMSTVSLSLVTFSTTSFFTSIIEPWSKKQAISRKELFLGLLVVFGMTLIFSFEKEHITAILVGLAGAILASIYSVANVHLTQKHSAISINLFQLGGAFLFTLPVLIFMFLRNGLSISHLVFTKVDFLYLLILALLCTVLPYLELIKLLKKLSAFSVNLVINMEPVYGILLAWVIFGSSERMTSGFYIGAALIVLSLILNFYWKTKKPSHF